MRKWVILDSFSTTSPGLGVAFCNRLLISVSGDLPGSTDLHARRLACNAGPDGSGAFEDSDWKVAITPYTPLERKKAERRSVTSDSREFPIGEVMVSACGQLDVA